MHCLLVNDINLTMASTVSTSAATLAAKFSYAACAAARNSEKDEPRHPFADRCLERR
jgi:hypothetical protein